MKTFVIFLVVAGLGVVFIIQKRGEQRPAATPVNTSQATTPRQPNEHDWAKRSLDTTNSVIQKIQKQRRDDDLKDAVGRR
jgi:hypothetical protein